VNDARKVKLKVYNRVKKEKGWAKYLENENIVGRSLLAMLRARTSWLRIEKGREDGLRMVNRVCRVCRMNVEDEEHYMRRCEGYVKERRECEEEMKKNWEWKQWSEEKREKAWWGESDVKIMISVLTRYEKKDGGEKREFWC